MERYQRQIALKDFGPNAQQALGEAKVLVIGAGGLGLPVLTYLNAMGVGHLGIMDDDVVALSNLHRQVLFNEKDLGRPKVAVAFEKLRKQNSSTNIKGYQIKLNAGNALAHISEYDLIVDCSDNFPTRYLVNDACVLSNTPFVYGALHGFEGQVSVFNFKDGPSYRCLFPKMPGLQEIPNCNDHGVLGVLPGIIGNLQAMEVVKMITGIGEVMAGRLLIYNALNQKMHQIKFSKTAASEAIRELEMDNTSYCGGGATSFDLERLQSEIRNGAQLLDVRSEKEYEYAM